MPLALNIATTEFGSILTDLRSRIIYSGKHNLSAVRMPTYLKINPRSVIVGHMFSHIWVMRKEDSWHVARNSLKCST